MYSSFTRLLSESWELSVERRKFLGLVGQLAVGCGQFIVRRFQCLTGSVKLTVAAVQE